MSLLFGLNAPLLSVADLIWLESNATTSSAKLYGVSFVLVLAVGFWLFLVIDSLLRIV
ncbi:hypothetical protein [Ursidibacter maritimus]|uniref:hypothetical protein n=1 Tax=Ursidibacter maritimus TaxID=1331689 RepID=UPI0012FC5A6F|nr:hypothetical protein [Ursidibacter maritimus]